MTYKIYPEQDVEAIAEAIRNKNGLSNKYKIGEMADAINNLGIYSLSGEDNAPYLYRKTPLTSDAELDKIVGGSVVFNQLVKNGDFADGTNNWSVTGGTTVITDGECEITLTTDSCQFYQNVTQKVEGHKTLVSFNGHATNTIRIGVMWGNTLTTNISISTAKTHISFIGNVGSGNNNNNLNFISAGATGDKVYLSNIQLIDLTQMFGTTIADYVYQLEQSTAGSGVAYLKSLGFFTDDYYPYNAGEIKSVSGLDSHDMVGFNQWDEEWENGWIDESGADRIGANDSRTKNYISVIPNTTYCVTTPYTINMRYYDADKNYIDKFDANSRGNVTAPYGLRTIPSNCAYIRFYIDESTYNNDICINISDTNRNGEYEPYIKHSYPLDNTITLRGIPKLVNNKIQYDGDVYNSDGSVDERFKIVTFDGSENWNVDVTSGHYRAFLYLDDIKSTSGFSTIANIICNRFPTGEWSDVYVGLPVIGQTGTAIGFGIDALGITTTSDIKSWLSTHQLTLVYEKATPTTESAEPYSTIQVCDGAGTEEYVTTGIPVGHETKYLEVVEI